MADGMKMTCRPPWVTAVGLLVWLGPSLAAFDKHPSDVTVVEGRETQLDCRVHGDASRAAWYVYTDTDTRVRIDDGFQNRFFVRINGGTAILFINDTSASDEGVYTCESGMSVSQNATLRVLPRRWTPQCTYSHDTPVKVGGRLDIMCVSSGDPDTSLRWMRNNDVVDMISRNINGSSVILHASVVVSEQAEVFICEASLPDLHATEICVLRPVKDRDPPLDAQYVAYAVVILLSIIVVVLFTLMIVVVLRQRQCRYFHRPQPPPQTVLDLAQLQSGSGLSGLSVGTQQSDADSIGSAFDLVGLGSLGPTPDVVPTDYRKGDVTERSSSPTSTIRHNMDLNYDPEKTGIKTPKIQSPRGERRVPRITQSSDMAQLGGYQDVADISFDPNIPSTSNGSSSNNHLPSTTNGKAHTSVLPRASNDDSFDSDEPCTSADDIAGPSHSPQSSGTTLKKNRDRLNDLGTLKKERLYEKSKMTDQRRKSLENNQLVTTGVYSVNNLESNELNIVHEEVD